MIKFDDSKERAFVWSLASDSPHYENCSPINLWNLNWGIVHFSCTYGMVFEIVVCSGNNIQAFSTFSWKHIISFQGIISSFRNLILHILPCLILQSWKTSIFLSCYILLKIFFLVTLWSLLHCVYLPLCW